MTLNTKKIICVVGPTAIGKTQLSICLAKSLKTEIISCDSRQFYRELQIGAAPPSKAELSTIKHHFIHHLSITQNYSAGEFETDAINLLKQLHRTNDTIIVVGGSGLYLDAICKGFDKMPKIPQKIRTELNQKYQNQGLSWLQKEIKKIDPNLYKKDNYQNPQRLLRALELFKVTGKNMSSFRSNQKKTRPFKIIKIGLNMQRDILYKKINDRVDIMIKRGLVDEVMSLINYQEKNALQTVGYREIFELLNNKCTLTEAVEKIKRNTRRFAKRQLTWFKKDKEIKWFQPNETMKIQEFIAKL